MKHLREQRDLKQHRGRIIRENGSPRQHSQLSSLTGAGLWFGGDVDLVLEMKFLGRFDKFASFFPQSHLAEQPQLIVYQLTRSMLMKAGSCILDFMPHGRSMLLRYQSPQAPGYSLGTNRITAQSPTSLGQDLPNPRFLQNRLHGIVRTALMKSMLTTV